MLEQMDMIGGIPELEDNGQVNVNDGRVAEFLVAVDLERRGYSASIINGREYDLLAEAHGGIVTIQVKSTLQVVTEIIYGGRCSRPSTRSYKWRGYKFIARSTSGGFGSYKLVDVFAFVALDIDAIVYLPVKQIGDGAMMRFREDQFNKLVNDGTFPND